MTILQGLILMTIMIFCVFFIGRLIVNFLAEITSHKIIHHNYNIMGISIMITAFLTSLLLIYDKLGFIGKNKYLFAIFSGIVIGIPANLYRTK